MSDFIISAEGVDKNYETGAVKVNALRGVDLHVERGEIVSIMGPSGCGKTTLLNCLSGLDDVDGGRVLIDGVVLNDLPDDEKTEYRARRMGFVFQMFNLLPVLSAVENVEMCQGRGDLVPRGGAKAYHWAVGVQHECHAAVGVSGGS